MAWTSMVKTSLHCTSRGTDALSLRSFTVKYSVWLYNWLPNKESGLTQLEIFTRGRSDYCDLIRCCVWGFPVLFLEPNLHNDQKIPKWNRRYCIGQVIGFLDGHSSIMANVRHLSAGYIYPRFHLVFDDLFEMFIR